MKRIFILFLLLHLLLAASAQRPYAGGYHVYYGNLHNHSSISDGSGSCNDAYNYAKNVSHQDFFSLADHCISVSSSEWTLMKNTADAYNEDGVFTTFWGFEWSSNSLYGHITVLGSDDYCTALSLSTNTFTKLCNWMNSRNCVALFNHPGRENDVGLEFNHFTSTPSDKFVGMELWNKGNGFSTWYYNDGYFSGDGGLGFFDEALTRGWYIGACGNEDNHDGDWGVREAKFAILSSELTRHHIWEALEMRRFFSTLDRNIEMSFKIHGHEMGSKLISGTYNGEIELHDADNENFVKVELLKNGQVVQTFNINDTNPLIPLQNLVGDHGDYFYIRAKQQDGDEAISSPVFFDDNLTENHLPAVQITYPTHGQTTASGILNITADAFDTAGFVKRVQFYVDDVCIGSDTTQPYSISYDFVNETTYNIKAMAFDDLGAVAFSEPHTLIISNSSGIVPSNATETPLLILLSEQGSDYLLLTGTSSVESYEIYAINGMLVQEGLLYPETRLNISSAMLNSGIYLIRLKSKPTVKSIRFFVP